MDKTLTYTEENYLKAIYHLSLVCKKGTISTNALAETMETTPASVNDMIKKLASKKLIDYQKYKGATLQKAGKSLALQIVRKHRLWEVFLVKKLGFKWDEVHEVAEQLEHIKSPLLISRLDDFLGNPTIDPHGDPIPDADGDIKEIKRAAIHEVPVGTEGILVTVTNDDSALLQHLDQLEISLGCQLKVLNKIDFDGSILISINETKEEYISKAISEVLMITIIE